MFKTKYLFFMILGLMSILMVACGGNDNAESSTEDNGEDENAAEDEINVGLAMKTQDSPYFVSLVESVQEFSDEEGWNLDILDANGDTTQESQNFSTFISQGKDLIFVDAIEPSAVVPSINQAVEAGIPVIALDSGVDEGANNVTTVYSNNTQNGRLVGIEYGGEMSNNDEIKGITLSGSRGNIAGMERRTGLYAGIIESRTEMSEEEAMEAAESLDSQVISEGSGTNEEANLTIVGQGWGNWTESGGLNAAEDLITSNPDITTVFGENDQMLFGAKTAITNASLNEIDLVAGADGAQDAFDLIKEGEYFGTGLNSPTLVAERSVEIAKEILVDGEDPESYPEITTTEPAAVTEENVDEYYDLGF